MLCSYDEAVEKNEKCKIQNEKCKFCILHLAFCISGQVLYNGQLLEKWSAPVSGIDPWDIDTMDTEQTKLT